jgi:serine/threonine protein kinase
VSGTTSFPSLGVGPPGPAAPDYAAGVVVVGRYLIRECVGAGPLGIVYRAEDRLAHEDVAVRIVWPDLVPDDRARLTFLRGATAARALQSPFVGGVRDAFIDQIDGQRACVMVGDFLRRPTLAARVAQRLRYEAPFLPVEVAPIVSQLGVGLSAAHRAGLVHGNLKARNVFFAGDEVRIGDLGVAGSLPPPLVARAQAQSAPDEPRAPEAALGGLPTVAGDVYALASITAEMLGLRQPRRQWEGPATPPPGTRPGEGGAGGRVAENAAEEVPPALRAVVERALSRNPRDRFADVDALASALLTAFQRQDRERSKSPAPAPQAPPPRAASKAVHASRGVDSAFVAGALDALASDKTPHLQLRPARPAPSVVVQEEDLDSRTPVTPPPQRAAPARPANMAGGGPVPVPPLGAAVRAVTRRRADVPSSLAVALVVMASSLALLLLHRIIDAHFAQKAAIARVEKARLLERLRAAERPAAAAPVVAPVPPVTCGPDMLPVPGGKSCIAAYEYPGPRARPRVGVTLDEARALCAQRQQRLCRQEEWVRACGGGAGLPFPYGSVPRLDTCNTATEDAPGGLVARAGQFRGCRTSAGAFDMTGNAAERVEEGLILGGDAGTRPEKARCDVAWPMPPQRRSPLVGFRCCSDVGGI